MAQTGVESLHGAGKRNRSLKFIGFGNYRDVINDRAFVAALVNCFKYLGWSLLLGFCLPIIVAIMIILSALCVLPPLWVMVSSLKDLKEFLSVPPTIIPKSFHPEKLAEMWKKMNFTSAYLNTLWVAIGSVICAIVFNGLVGYVLSRLKPAGTVLVFSLMLWTMMLPNTVGLVPLYKHIVNLKLLNSFIPLWLMRGASAYNVIVFKSFFDSISKEYIEAARIDGCTDLMIFFRIVVPLSKPVIMVITLFTLNGVWSDFLWPYLTLTDKNLFTVMVKLYRSSSYSVDKKMIAMTFAIIPPIILFAIFQKHIMTGFSLGGIKG